MPSVTKNTHVPCQNLSCPLNVTGLCGPAYVRLKYERKLSLIHSLPWWKRLLFETQLKIKAKKRRAVDYGSLVAHATRKDPVAGLFLKLNRFL